MSVNQSVIFGNMTVPVVDFYAKADAAVDGALSLFILLILVLIIVMSVYKKYNNFLKGLSIGGFVGGILGGFLTVIGYLSWDWIWMCVVLFIVGFMAKAFEK